MLKPLLLLLCLVSFLSFCSNAQDDSNYIKQFIKEKANILAGDAMMGRGYVYNGRGVAAEWLKKNFTEMGLKPVDGNSGFAQQYTFPINAFPGKMTLAIDNTTLKPGADFIIDASSAPYNASGLKLKVVDMGKINTPAQLKHTLKKLKHKKAWLLENTDTLCKKFKTRPEQIATLLNSGCYIIPTKNKLTWTVEGYQNRATVFYVKQDLLPVNLTKVSLDIDASLLSATQNENLIATIPGEVKDTFIAFTGHYDHLGMMGGHSAIFPGASDNASGMSMLIYLASYFTKHPQHYSILFIAFSGEEAGLLGSEYYINHQLVPVGKIKFLTNIDIMGDASDGITVVNATEYKQQFGLMQQINDQNHYLPIIKQRGKAHNSDHWYFTEAGVPSFFIYSNGGKGYYHDIYDKPTELTLNHVAGVAQLLIDFVRELK